MAVNYREVPNQYPEDAANYASGINKVNVLVERLRRGGELPERFGLATNTARQSSRGESLPTPEPLVLRPRFTDVEREGLLGDEAKILTLSGTTIPQQREARGDKPSFWHIVNAGELLLPSREGQEVAFFPDLGRFKRFFVEGTFGKDTDTQERLVRAAGDALADRLNLKNPQGKRTIAGILTDEAATWSDLTFQYLEDPDNKNGVWLFGPEYARAQGKAWAYGRTKNKTNDSGSNVALVGFARPERGLDVLGWGRDGGSDSVGGPLLVVPIETK